MLEDEIKNEVIALISELFAEKRFDTDIIEYIDLIDDAGMDSITFISIVVEIEARFDIIVPDDMLEMDRFRRVDDIVTLIIEQKKGCKEGTDNE